MSRVIKFRAWFDNGKAQDMFFVGDAYGTTHPLDCCRYAQDGQAVTLMQFTGLTDKNGAEIYEGDILSAPFANGEYAKNIKHKFFNVSVTISPERGASIEFPKSAWKGNYRWYPHFNECEVIGNIYQNHELLENKNG